MRISHLLILSAAVLGFAQEKPAAAPGSKLEFEVATVKPSEPIEGMGQKVMVRIGVRNDGAMVTYNRMTLKQLVQNAYAVKDYQVTGAPWMDQAQYDISAKMPDGANKDQAPEMLQTLLKERFKLEIHREKKDHPVYALVAVKGGPKLKVADPNNAFPALPGGAPPPPPPPAGGAPANTTVGVARGPAPPEGAMMMRMGPNGGHVDMRAITLQRLAEAVSRYVERPVIDETGIEGKYDFGLDVSAEEMGNMPGMKNAMPMMAAMNAGRGGDDGPPKAPEGGSIFQSLQSYGLKLEPKKAPIEVITIDSAEKTPIQN